MSVEIKLSAGEELYTEFVNISETRAPFPTLPIWRSLSPTERRNWEDLADYASSGECGCADIVISGFANA